VKNNMSEEKKEVAKKDTQDELAAIQADPEMAKMYAESAGVGSENLGGVLPQLKVYSAGRSKYTLANGDKPTDGYFFYTPTKEQFKELEVHILTVSKGFQAPGMPDKNGNTELKFNQVVGGVIVDKGEYKPFLMYFTGTKLANLWAFGKEAHEFTQRQIPLFALTVVLKTKSITTSFGESWVVDINIVRDGEGRPTLVHDKDEFRFLREKVDTLSQSIGQIIQAKAGSEQIEEAVVTEEVKEEVPNDPDDVNF
jgi:hypothetical protein